MDNLESDQAYATQNNQYPGASKEEIIYCQTPACGKAIDDPDSEYCEECRLDRAISKAESLEGR